jgi:hypothetical protein
VAPLGDGVAGIVRLSTQPQVIGIDAGRNVAVMKNIQAHRDLASVELPREAMGSLELAGVASPELSVAERGLRPSPEPAVARAIYEGFPPLTLGAMKGAWRRAWGQDRQGIAVFPPSDVMTVAPTPRVRDGLATVYRASSHASSLP